MPSTDFKDIFSNFIAIIPPPLPLNSYAEVYAWGSQIPEREDAERTSLGWAWFLWAATGTSCKKLTENLQDPIE